jgi:hypothetical protein
LPGAKKPYNLRAVRQPELDIHGIASKAEVYNLDTDQQSASQVGLFFDDGQTPPVKAEIIAVNEPRTLKAIVPATLGAGGEYALKVVTQSSAKGSGSLLKNPREVRSDFKLTAQN